MKILILLFILFCLLIISFCKDRTSVNDGYGVFLYIHSGEFQMGDNLNEGDADEHPVHKIFLNSYYIGKYLTTNGDYKKFIDDAGYGNEKFWIEGGFEEFRNHPLYWNDSLFRGGGITGNENFPVVGVSWYEANAYCKWLSSKTKKNYRLPTEAEWEKAARGTDQRRYPWGDMLDQSYANYFQSNISYNNLTPVGYYDGNVKEGFITKENASPYGVYDMAGNAWEWCYDWYGSDYYFNSPAKNPTGPLEGEKKVIRGGSWKSVPSTLRSSKRGGNDPPSLQFNTLGFRCVRDK